MIVKKNARILRYLNTWAKNLSPVDIDQPIPNIPILVIDDEADYASVNTNKSKDNDDETLDPTAINGLIRNLLDSFASSAYVGYTATPFANIFISPDQSTEDHGADLFPRDFLINIPTPSNHVGPTSVFGLRPDSTLDIEPVEPLPLVIKINDYSDLIPDVHTTQLIVSQLPESLVEAMKTFILVCAARAARGSSGEHNSMLVHVTRYQKVQKQITDLVELELNDLQNRIRYGDGGSAEPILEELKNMWVEGFERVSDKVRQMEPELSADCERVSWNDVMQHLIQASQKIQVKTINGSAKDALDYWDQPNGLSAIAIGGDKLSRGLTLEGLSVSYYLRSTKMYDTLLQMGRWFGYRPGYVDLCRLYTSEELVRNYTHITLAIEELKQEFEVMADRGLSPDDFGLKVRTHPAGLMITAANKMRYGTRMRVSYGGDVSETISFDKNPEVIEANRNTYDRFFRRLTGNPRVRTHNKIWSGVPGEHVADLLASVRVHESSARRARGDLLAKYIRSQLESGGLESWSVALVSNPEDPDFEIGGQSVRRIHREQYPDDSRDIDSVYRIRRLVNPDDELIDLTDAQKDQAKLITIQHYYANPGKTRYKSEPDKAGGRFIRQVREHSKGLLLVYPLDQENGPFLGFGVSFPKPMVDTPVEYIVNSVYYQQEFGL